MRSIVVGLGLAVLASSAVAQSSPVASPPAGEPVAHNLNPPDSPTVVMVVPDPSATAMADPQSAAQFGSPSAVDSPSSPMPNPMAWPAVKPSAKRPPWVKKAPNAAPPPPPPSGAP
ncbi:MAG TPA: hypothetical protein VGN38_00905 [Caulobacteraceae bacterium]|nr:hypothetical protein [Caulobacteraceae bacterium]